MNKSYKMQQPATWIRREHQEALDLTFNYYTTPLKKYGGWTLISSTTRIGVYKFNHQYIIVCKGTTPTHAKDVFDDLRIAGLLNGLITIEREARVAVKKILNNDPSAVIQMTGHSLGGRCALTIAAEFNLQAVVFNPAAPFTNPLSKGPGPEKAVSYHIIGDGISSHVKGSAAEVIRVDMNYNVLQTVSAHTMDNFYGDKKVYGFYSAQQEDAFLNLTTTLAMAAIISNDKELREIYSQLQEMRDNPIPDSIRDSQENANPAGGIATVFGGTIVFVSKVYDKDVNIRILQKTFGIKQTGLYLPEGLRKIGLVGKSINVTGSIGQGLKRLGENLVGARLIDATMDYIEVKAGYEKLNDLLKEFNAPEMKPGEVTMVTSNKPLTNVQISDQMDLQKIGMDNDVLAKIDFSAKTPNPSEFLDEASDFLLPPSKPLAKIQNERLNWQTNPIYESKWKTNPLYEPPQNPKWTVNPIYKPRQAKATFTKKFSNPVLKEKSFKAGQRISKKVSVIKRASAVTSSISRSSVAQKALKVFARIGTVVGKVMGVLLPIIAAADLAYTVYLLGKGIATNDYNDLVEYMTGFDIDTWKGVGEDLKKGFEGKLPQWDDNLRANAPSCKMCPPGSALYWDGEECKRNPCQPKQGMWGVYNKETNTCQYPLNVLPNPINPLLSQNMNAPAFTVLPSTIDDPKAAQLEQDNALQNFQYKKEEWHRIFKEVLDGTASASLIQDYKDNFDYKKDCNK
jgi:hypothetical protein